MAEIDTDFEATEASASKTVPIQASSLRKGDVALLGGNPCKISDMSTSKTGKHGHAKINFTGFDIFTDKKCEEMCQSTHNMDKVVVKRTDYKCIDINDGFMTLITIQTQEEREPIALPKNDLGTNATKLFDEEGELVVTIVAAMDKERVVDCKSISILGK